MQNAQWFMSYSKYNVFERDFQARALRQRDIFFVKRTSRHTIDSTQSKERDMPDRSTEQSMTTKGGSCGLSFRMTVMSIQAAVT